MKIPSSETFLSLAYDTNNMPESCTDESLIRYSKALYEIAYNNAITDASELIRRDLIVPRTPYQEQYNYGVQSFADNILKLGTM